MRKKTETQRLDELIELQKQLIDILKSGGADEGYRQGVEIGKMYGREGVKRLSWYERLTNKF